MPEDLPDVAKPFWPRYTDWPDDSDIRGFVHATDETADVRLAVLTGLHRWAEPGSSQLMVSLGSLLIAVAAIGVSLSTLDPLFYIGVVIAAVIYIVIALIVFGRAAAMDQRRKMAHAWLIAIENELATHGKSAIAHNIVPVRSWFEAIRLRSRK